MRGCALRHWWQRRKMCLSQQPAATCLPVGGQVRFLSPGPALPALRAAPQPAACTEMVPVPSPRDLRPACPLWHIKLPRLPPSSF